MADRTQTPLYNTGLESEPDIIVVDSKIFYSYISYGQLFIDNVLIKSNVRSYHLTLAVDESLNYKSSTLWLWYVGYDGKAYVEEYNVLSNKSLSLIRNKEMHSTETAEFIQAKVKDGLPSQAVILDNLQMIVYLYQNPFSEDEPVTASMEWEYGTYSVVSSNRDKFSMSFEDDGNIASSTIIYAYNVIYVTPEGDVIYTDVVEYESDSVPPSEAPDIEGKVFGGWSSEATSVTTDLVITAMYFDELVFTLHPEDYYTTADKAITLKGDTNGGIPNEEGNVVIIYQWQYGGQDIQGATDKEYTMQQPIEGNYRLVASDGVNVVFSNEALVTVAKVEQKSRLTWARNTRTVRRKSDYKAPHVKVIPGMPKAPRNSY